MWGIDIPMVHFEGEYSKPNVCSCSSELVVEMFKGRESISRKQPFQGEVPPYQTGPGTAERKKDDGRILNESTSIAESRDHY